LVDKELNVQLLDSSAKYSLGTLIRESLGTNRAQLEQYRLEEVDRTEWSGVTPGQVTEGTVWKSLTLIGKLPGSAQGEVVCEIRLNQVFRQLDLTFSLKKLSVTDPEALYVAFPFRLPDSRFEAEIAGAAITPGVDQLEGSSSDWLGFQNYIALRNNQLQILWTAPETPLVQLGGINLGEFARKANPKTTHLYSWVMNNYWTTNFLASEEGELKWRYFLSSSADTSELLATRFGWGTRIPLLTRIFPAASPDSVVIPRSFLGSALRDVLLVAAYPSADGKGVILHLREVNGAQVRFPVRDYLVSIIDLVSATQASRIAEVNVLEEEIRTIFEEGKSLPEGIWMELAPCETKFLKLELPERTERH